MPDVNVYYQSREAEIYSGTVTLIVLASLAVGARIVARGLSVAKYWWDDYMIVLTLVRNPQASTPGFSSTDIRQLFNWGLCVCAWVSIRLGGLGRHTTAYSGPVGPYDLRTYYKVSIIRNNVDFSDILEAFTSGPNAVLCLQFHRQNIIDLTLLPYLWNHSLVSMAASFIMGSIASDFRDMFIGSIIGMQANLALLERGSRRKGYLYQPY